MQHADLLTVVHHDDTTTDFTDVRYTLTRAGLRVLDADNTETVLDTHNVLTTHARTPPPPGGPAMTATTTTIAIAAGVAEPTSHPVWCDLTRCTVLADLPLDDAVHLSHTVTVDGAITTVGPEDIDVWLHQGAAGGDVYLVVDVLGGVRAMFSLTAATTAVTAVTDLIDQATDTTAAGPNQ